MKERQLNPAIAGVIVVIVALISVYLIYRGTTPQVQRPDPRLSQYAHPKLTHYDPSKDTTLAGGSQK